MPVKLSEALLDSLVPSERDQYLFDTVVPTFAFRLMPKGRGIYYVGLPPRHTVGHRPPLRLAEARDLAAQMRTDIRLGHDPRTAREARARAAASGQMLVSQFVEKWLNRSRAAEAQAAHKSGLREARCPAHQSGARPSAGGAGGSRGVVQLHLAMRRTPRRANYTVSTAHAIFNFAEDLGLRPRGSNPAKRIKRNRERKIERFPSEAEIAKAAEGIAAAERAGKIGPHAAAGLRLALFTGARSGEVTAAQWSHVDWQRQRAAGRQDLQRGVAQVGWCAARWSLNPVGG